MNSGDGRVVEEWTQIHEECLQGGSRRVDTGTRRLHNRGQWKSTGTRT